MIETIMIFAIGFLAAALLALLILPALSRRAERLARRRVEARLPTSLAQVAAERDQLRAELAVESRRVEIRADAVSAERATGLLELGRRDVQIASLQAELAARSQALSTLEGEHAALVVKQAETQATLERTSTDLAARTTDLATVEKALTGLRDEHRALLQLAEERRLSIAGLETTGEGLRIRITDLERTIADTAATLATERIALAEQQTQVAVLQHKLAALQHDKDERDKLIEHLRTNLATAVAEAEKAAGAQGEISLNLAAAKARVETLEAERDAAVKAREAAGGELASAAEALRADKAAAEGALATARSERRALVQELDSLRRQQEVALGTLRAENRTLRAELERTGKPSSAEDAGERRSLRLAVTRESRPGNEQGSAEPQPDVAPADEGSRILVKPTASAKG